MIKDLKELKRILKKEKKRYKVSFFGYLLSFFGISEQNIIWRYQKNLRKWEYHYNRNHKIRCLLSQTITTSIGNKYGFHISPNSCDEGLKIMHLGSILINSNARIGQNCVLHINTSFVASGGSDLAPITGDNCLFYVGATIIGNIKLGSNIIVGAGSVVTKDFNGQSNITIAGVPASIIRRNNQNE